MVDSWFTSHLRQHRRKWLEEGDDITFDAACVAVCPLLIFYSTYIFSSELRQPQLLQQSCGWRMVIYRVS